VPKVSITDLEGVLASPNTQALNGGDGGSVTDTQQWCQLHRGHCNDVVPVRRVFESVAQGADKKTDTEVFFACQACIRDLKKAELIKESKYAGLPCVEVVVPKGLSKGRGLERSGNIKQSFEVTLDALQVKYLRALGLRVIKA